MNLPLTTLTLNQSSAHEYVEILNNLRCEPDDLPRNGRPQVHDTFDEEVRRQSERDARERSELDLTESARGQIWQQLDREILKACKEFADRVPNETAVPLFREHVEVSDQIAEPVWEPSLFQRIWYGKPDIALSRPITQADPEVKVNLEELDAGWPISGLKSNHGRRSIQAYGDERFRFPEKLDFEDRLIFVVNTDGQPGIAVRRDDRLVIEPGPRARFVVVLPPEMWASDTPRLLDPPLDSAYEHNRAEKVCGYVKEPMCEVIRFRFDLLPRAPIIAGDSRYPSTFHEVEGAIRGTPPIERVPSLVLEHLAAAARTLGYSDTT